MSSHVYKRSSSRARRPPSIEDAITGAIAKASKTIRNMQWFQVCDTRGHIADGKVAYWQITLKVGFTLRTSGESTANQRPTIGGFEEGNAMASPSPRRKDALAVHSLQRFVFSVPDLADAAKFYRTFGLDVREVDGRLDLYAFGHPHRWASIYQRAGGKRLEYIALGAYTEDYDALVERLGSLGVPSTAPHPLADDEGVWITDPEGIAVEIVRADKVSPDGRRDPPGERVNGKAAAPARSKAPPTRPRHLSHILMFTSDVHALGGVLPRRAWPAAVGPLRRDHRVHARRARQRPSHAGVREVGRAWSASLFVGRPTIDAVGIGMEQMGAAGYIEGWGVGRHVIGSNYFRYIRDPWGSFAEYSADIDYIPADVDWPAADHPPEDSFYVWGPPVPGLLHPESRDRGAQSACRAIQGGLMNIVRRAMIGAIVAPALPASLAHSRRVRRSRSAARLR